MTHCPKTYDQLVYLSPFVRAPQASQAASAASAAESSMASETEDLCGYVEERLEEVRMRWKYFSKKQ